MHRMWRRRLAYAGLSNDSDRFRILEVMHDQVTRTWKERTSRIQTPFEKASTRLLETALRGKTEEARPPSLETLSLASIKTIPPGARWLIQTGRCQSLVVQDQAGRIPEQPMRRLEYMGWMPECMSTLTNAGKCWHLAFHLSPVPLRSPCDATGRLLVP
jgi:hypothetical protein